MNKKKNPANKLVHVIRLTYMHAGVHPRGGGGGGEGGEYSIFFPHT